MPANSLADPMVISAAIRSRALELGFDSVGIAPISASAHAETYRAWVDAGMAGEMTYLTREDVVAKRADPRRVLPVEPRSAVVVTMGYYSGSTTADEDVAADRGIFARYARNDDYHD